MKLRFLTFLVILLSALSSIGQVYNPVKWSFDYSLEGDEHAILKFTANIEQGWHVYATQLESDMGPIPTEIVFGDINGAELVGKIKEPKPHKEYDPNFEMELSWFETKVTISQKVKLTAPMATVKGELTYMTCDDTKCLPPEYIDFNFEIEAALKPNTAATPIAKSPAETKYQHQN